MFDVLSKYNTFYATKFPKNILKTNFFRKIEHFFTIICPQLKTFAYLCKLERKIYVYEKENINLRRQGDNSKSALHLPNERL